MNRSLGIAGLAGLALLAASEAMSSGERIPSLKAHEPKAPPREKSASLQRMLRKARS